MKRSCSIVFSTLLVFLQCSVGLANPLLVEASGGDTPSVNPDLQTDATAAPVLKATTPPPGVLQTVCFWECVKGVAMFFM